MLSHWVLDFVTHAPDMPLWPGPSPRLGLGLWNSIPGTSIVEGTSGPSATSPRVDDYKVTFQACATLDQKFTFDGVVQLKAAWTGAVDAAYCDDCKLTSDSLMIRGTEEHCDEPHIDRTCKVSFTVKGTAPNVPQSYDGTICDVSFP